MGGFAGALNGNFNEPQSVDETSAPPIQVPQGAQLTPRAQGIATGLAAALAKRKKAGTVGPTSRAPSTLAAAISRAKRAHQGGDKYG